jgi:hypothetical protein
MLADGVGPGEEQALVAGVLPPDDTGRTAVSSSHLEDFRVPVWLPGVVALDGQSVTDAGCPGNRGSAVVGGERRIGALDDEGHEETRRQ